MKKTIQKLLSVILVAAICVSTLCGSLIVSNAASTGTYSVVGDAVGAGTKVVTMEVTITGNSLTSGTFDLMFGKDVIDDVNFDENGNYVTPTNETLEDFYARDKVDPVTGERNFMIAAVNYYKEVQVEEPVYDSEGNQTGTQTVTKTVVDTDKSYKENTGNKGTLLPNAYDGMVGLYNTKIEITGGVLADGTVVDANSVSQYFNNSGYAAFSKGENNTTNAIAGDSDDGRKFIYNITDNYKTASGSKTTLYTVADGESTKNVYKLDEGLLDKYYREYTTVDVATETLGYSISTVSEDSVGQTHSYAQYAQGFKDITFNSSDAFTSITFTVTFDFTGTCDRVGANGTVAADEVIGTTTVDGVEEEYRNRDGHWATENYVQYDKKYALNFVGKDSLSGLSAGQENSSTNYFHVHDGIMDENKYGTVDPINKDAIDALLAKNPNAKEGVDYFELYNARCQKCSRVTPMLAAPDLPYKLYEKDENDEDVEVPANGRKGKFSFNNFRNISGASVTYEDDGSLSLNLHYPSSMDYNQMIITDQNGMVMSYSDTLEVASDKTQKYTDVKSSFAASKIEVDGTEIARYEGQLPSASKMITVKGFSASDIEKTLYVARYTPVSETETQLMGITHSISIAEYCNEVVKGEYDDADKLVAAALANYANAATTALGTAQPENPKIIPTEIDLLEFGDYLINDLGSTSKWYDTKLADNGETGADWDNAIIIDSAEELVYLCKASGNDTKGKYYKVADNILGFNLASSSLDINGSLADNIEIIKKAGKNHAGAAPGFQGHFDGNGATVYGAWSNHNTVSTYAGLFTCTQGEVTIKNINVNKAHFTATTAAGGIVAYYMGEGNYTNNTTLTIENCSVTDSYLNVTGTGYGVGIGAIVGRVNCPSSYVDTNDEDGDNNTTERLYVNNKIIVKNCYVNLDEANFVSVAEDGVESSGERACHGGVAGMLGSNALAVSNCVVLGITPYATSESTTLNDVQHSGLESHFANVYTTSDVAVTGVTIGGTLTGRNFTGKVIPLSDEQLKGLNVADNMPNLNWDTIWCATEGYPTLYAPYNIPEVEDKTIYWDGTTATGISQGSGTKDDPYIINTAAELAYVVSRPLANYADTDGKYFKVADGIKNIVLQPEAKAADIMSLSDSAAVKSYFESGSGFKAWKTGGWEGTTFCGNIDFNGVTIYGAYIKDSANNAALICNVDAGAVISNLTLKNSYFTSAASNYQVAALAAVSNGSGYGKKANGIVWINGVTIANNYLYNTSTQTNRSGVMVGSFSDTVYVDNCLVYGNDATYGADVKMPLINNAGNALPSTATVPEGLVTKIDVTDGGNLHFNMVRSSVILGCDPYDVTQVTGSRFNDARSFEDVYSDAEVANVAFPDKNLTFTPAQITKINADDIKGYDAKVNMPHLDWYNALTNPDGAWHYGYGDTMPKNASIGDSIIGEIDKLYPGQEDIYNNIEFIEDTYNSDSHIYDTVGTKGLNFGVYATSLNLKTSPYISFTFAFNKEYKAVRDQIKITITTSKGSYELPSMVATNGNEDVFFKQNGWTHNENSGRYHLYRFTGISISEMVGDMTITAYDPIKGETVELGKFSAGGFGYELTEANKIMPCDYYESRIEATRALIFYAMAIQTRYGA